MPTRVLGLIPSHNEQEIIGAAITALTEQSRPPERIVVVADNCTDATVQIARDLGAEVFVTVDNVHKKGGALNQALDAYLPHLGEDDYVFVQDADSVIRRDFLANAEACSGVGLTSAPSAAPSGPCPTRMTRPARSA